MAIVIDILNERSNPRLEIYIRRRLAIEVGKFDQRIDRIEVQLYDENGAKGGKDDKICEIDLRLNPRGTIHVSGRHDNIYGAALQAIHRAELAVAKAVDRGHRSKRIRRRRDGLRDQSIRIVTDDNADDIKTATQ